MPERSPLQTADETTMLAPNPVASLSAEDETVDLPAVWERVRKRLRTELGEDVFSSWFARLELETVADDTAHLSVPTRFLKSWIQAHFADRITRAFAAELPAVRDILQALEGIPLAIELAASRMGVLSAAAVRDRLKDRFALLKSQGRYPTERQATLRGAIDWSWDLLDAHERSALAQLSVFRGGFPADGAEAVVKLPADAPEVLDVLTSLHQKSLLKGSTRFGVNPSNVLGTDVVAPLTMASAFAAFASGGVYCNPVAITGVTDTNGAPLPIPDAGCHQAIEPRIANTMNFALSGVWQGTADGVGAPPFPSAGKTGTTTDPSWTPTAGGCWWRTSTGSTRSPPRSASPRRCIPTWEPWSSGRVRSTGSWTVPRSGYASIRGMSSWVGATRSSWPAERPPASPTSISRMSTPPGQCRYAPAKPATGTRSRRDSTESWGPATSPSLTSWPPLTTPATRAGTSWSRTWCSRRSRPPTKDRPDWCGAALTI